jgi:hypothetical protein
VIARPNHEGREKTKATADCAEDADRMRAKINIKIKGKGNINHG